MEQYELFSASQYAKVDEGNEIASTILRDRTIDRASFQMLNASRKSDRSKIKDAA